MKKLLFVLALTFVGQQAFTQMYIVTLTAVDGNHPSGCPPTTPSTPYYVLTKVDPTGNATYTCIDHTDALSQAPTALITLNQELNNIISQGFKLVYTSSGEISNSSLSGQISYDRLNYHTIWYFAIPQIFWGEFRHTHTQFLIWHTRVGDSVPCIFHTLKIPLNFFEFRHIS